jgi:V/A-type H+-transporting ATPase subunit I
MLHVTEYDGSWDAFRPGDPAEGAETASDKLVTVRSLLSILDVDEESVSAAQSIDEEALADRLESVRERVNELDDRRASLRDDLRDVDERLDAIEPFADLGIDLDLLQGYETVEVAVGRGRRDRVERTLVDADEVTAYQFFEGEGGVVAVVARLAGATLSPDADDESADGVLADVLVGTEFQMLEVPDIEDEEATSPGDYATRLRERRTQIRAKLETAKTELEQVRAEQGSFLLAAEEELAIRVEKTEAPLTFATTDNAFVAEGWMPTERYTDFAGALQDAVGDHVEVEELERAEFTPDGAEHSREEVSGGSGVGEPTAAADGGPAADGDVEARADGGELVTMNDDDPPVIQDNPDVVRPFELLTQAVGRPQYREFDPTVVLFLTFPLFFGFMIGDVGYGIIYTAIGYYLWSSFDSDAFRSLGGITIASGLFTILFGILYGELFGTHVIAQFLWHDAVGLKNAPIKKGLESAEFVFAWIVVSVFVGILHLNVAWVFDFVEKYQLHDLQEALAEAGSWLLMLNGIWVWVFSSAFTSGIPALGIAGGFDRPDFVFTVFNGEPFALGFAGFPSLIGWAGFVAFVVGLLLLAVGTGSLSVEVVEFLNVLVNALSYTRIAAVLLAKAGMAFAVNFIVFGEVGGESTAVFAHPLAGAGPEHGLALVHQGPLLALVGIVVLILGHALVLILGISSAGLQAVRLEYVEFFTKFYSGGGREYAPLGHERRFTRES